MPITKAVAVVTGTHERMEALVVATVLWNDVDKRVVLSERDARRLRRRVGESKADADRFTIACSRSTLSGVLRADEWA